MQLSSWELGTMVLHTTSLGQPTLALESRPCTCGQKIHC